jgi:uncharacterized protein
VPSNSTASNDRILAWHGPDPVRIDAAQVVLGADRLRARGTSATSEYTLDWSLTTDPAWVTHQLSVRARGDGSTRSLELHRDDEGGWSALRQVDGGETEPLVVAGLDAALDCDLALCPFTNTMPVLRHDLVAAAQHGRSAAVDLVMAWVSVPDLTVHPSSQRYTVVGPAANGGALIRYTSGTFEATIDFDRDGLVREYPALGTRIHPKG